MAKSLQSCDRSYVYVIGQPDGPQKVGFSQHPPTRALALKKAGQPVPTVHAYVEVLADTVRQVEALAHWLLRDKSLGHEHFDVTPDEASAIIEEAARRHASGERAPTAASLARNVRIPLALPEYVLDVVEEWRATQRPIPNVSEAIRRLIQIGLDAERAAKPIR